MTFVPVFLKTIAFLMVIGFLFPCIAHAELKAAATAIVVTPDLLLSVSGGASVPKPSTQKFGDLKVRALVIQKDDTYVAIVSGDFLGFPGVLCDRVRAQVKEIPAANIIIGATHAHSAPDMYGMANEKGECLSDLKYMDFVCSNMADAIHDALKQLQPVTVKINVDKANGKIAYNYYAPQLYDPRMGVIQFIASTGDAKGKAVATLVNYATHPEIIGSDQGILSPDLVQPLCDRIAEKNGGVGIFMNSAQGGMVTADCRSPQGDIQTWDECIRIGQLMADEALRIITDAPAQDDPALFCGVTKITFPVETELMQFILKTSPLKFPVNADGSVSTQVNVVNLGNAQILTIPGEALPNVGYYLKRNMHGKFNFLFGLTNDAFGYMMTKVDWNSFDRYDYISRTTLGENTADIYTRDALKFVDSCPRP